MLRKLNLYLVHQDIINGYDTYSEIVVAAATPGAAKRFHPSTFIETTWDEDKGTWVRDGEIYRGDAWPNRLEDLKCKYLGKASSKIKVGIISSSFHAG